MKRVVKNIFFAINSSRLIFHILLFKLKADPLFAGDLLRWKELYHKEKHSDISAFLHFLIYKPEFRNLFYYRMGNASRVIKFLCPQMNTLYINTKKIGKGLFIAHGFSCIISAESIGENFWVLQQVTVGSAHGGDPVIGNNVRVFAGAKVIGKIKIGNNVDVGANAVVVKDVPDNSTAVGVPARIIKRDIPTD
ncbi:serine O-acetyltransferase [Mucilaginibacter sp. R-33]|uniref:serine O-acetyltransferase n=2 Tax=unclassified Mucilaginibacter TaxID=2617802 RepID=UPI003CE708C3